MVTNSPPKKKKFINSINYFRGLAIILIVLGHSNDLARYDMSSNLEALFLAFIKNSTVYFIFISGFLYYHIFYHKFNYKKFMIKKSQYVLLPYLLISIIPVVLTVFLLDGGRFLPDSLREQPLLAIIWYLLTGQVSAAYWYIPMAMLLFAISPLINLIIRANIVLPVALFLLPISVMAHRPIYNLNVLHSLIYFFPVYLIGIWSAINNKKIYAYLKDNKKKIVLVLIALAFGVIQIWVFKQPASFYKDFWTVTVPDVNLLQKISLCFFFMSILDNYEDTNFTVANKVAETSFAIYFIHSFILNVSLAIIKRLDLNYEGNFFTFILIAFGMVVGSMAIAFAIKAVLKKKSRYLIGW